MKGIGLASINNVLRCMGMVLVVATGDGSTRFWIETWRGYRARTERLP